MSQMRFLLTPQWIGWGCMLTGGGGAVYCFVNVVQYVYYRRSGLIPPLFGVTPMAFETALITFFYGMALFWIGYLIKQFDAGGGKRGRLTRREKVEVVLAVISLLSGVFTATAAVLKK